MEKNERSALRRFTDKLYGGLNMSWPAVIALAAASAALTAVFLIVPVFKDTSFYRMGVYLEAWIFLAVIIMANCRTPAESALKTFVFFLISQPLIYLLQVPFARDGFGIFKFYRYWFIVTLLTLPAAFIGWYIKKKNWISLLIFLPVLGFLSYAGVEAFRQAAADFPKLLVTALFCLAQVLLYVYTFTSNIWQKLIGLAVPLAIAAVLSLRTPHFLFAMYDDLPDSPALTSGVTVTVEDPSIADVEIVLPEDGRYHLEAHKYGETLVIVKDAEQELKYDLKVYEKDGVTQVDLTPEK